MLSAKLFGFKPSKNHLPLVYLLVIFFIYDSCPVFPCGSVHLLGAKQCQTMLLGSLHHFMIVVLRSPIIKSIPFKHYFSFIKNPRGCDDLDRDQLLTRYPLQDIARSILLFQGSFPILLKTRVVQNQSFIVHLKLFKPAHTALDGDISRVGNPVS